MCQICNGEELHEKMRVALGAADEFALAVAFWGVGAEDLFSDHGNEHSRIICNLESGATNPSVIRKIQKKGIEVRTHDRLHAKIGLVGDDFSFLGSSNMSSNGLGLEAVGEAYWEEVNIVFQRVKPKLRERFEQLWSASEHVTEKHLEAAEDIWRKRRLMGNELAKHPSKTLKSLWAAIKDNDAHLRSLPCSVAYYPEMCGDELEEYEEAVGQIESEIGKKIVVYSDWPELPCGYIIGVEKSRDGKMLVRGTDYSIKFKHSPTRKIDSIEYLATTKIGSIKGFQKLKKDDRKSFMRLVAYFIESKVESQDVSGPDVAQIIPIQELMDFYTSAGVD